ncbi:MAG: hypothetical protein EBW05_13500 [Betaproteobacteria bacterium]|nr:hypothetical protein [Betaproteobacteria bacterium]
MGIAAWWINGHVFANYEVAQGVNLIYWPHGLRVVLTLLFERYAVIGLIGGSFFVAQLTWPAFVAATLASCMTASVLAIVTS